MKGNDNACEMPADCRHDDATPIQRSGVRMRSKGNEEFAKWWNRWTSRIQRNRAVAKQIHPARDMRGDSRDQKPQPAPGGVFRRFLKPYDKAS